MIGPDALKTAVAGCSVRLDFARCGTFSLRSTLDQSMREYTRLRMREWPQSATFRRRQSQMIPWHACTVGIDCALGAPWAVPY